MPKLRVTAEWRAPVGRNAAEADWFRVAKTIVPEAVPEVIFHDPQSGLFAMQYFAPENHPVWKAQLRDGHVEIGFAARVGASIGRIHAATMNDTVLAERFANDDTFHAIRLDPYLEATAHRHAALADRLMELSRATLARHQALVHGDVSPKNILAGPRGPVLLDAECAWYGDPAFDLAFCLNHLLLKCVWNRPATAHFLTAFAALREAYMAAIPSAAAEEIEARAARLLPCLLLARVDGKSPVEYLTTDGEREAVRRCATALIATPPQTLAEIAEVWSRTP